MLRRFIFIQVLNSGVLLRRKYRVGIHGFVKIDFVFAEICMMLRRSSARWYLFILFLNAKSHATEDESYDDPNEEAYEDEEHDVEKSNLDGVGNKFDELDDRLDLDDSFYKSEYDKIDYNGYAEDEEEEYDDDMEYYEYDDDEYNEDKSIISPYPSSQNVSMFSEIAQSSSFTVSIQNLFSEHQCNGILLSDVSVLTTCSCLMFYDLSRKKHSILKPADVQWSAVIGEGNHKQNRFASVFIVHSNCRHILGSFFAYNLGLINVDFRFGIRKGETEIAPFYSLSVNIAKAQWNSFTRRNENCTLVGFYRLSDKSKSPLTTREFQMKRGISCTDFLCKSKVDETTDDKISCFVVPSWEESDRFLGANLQCGRKFFGLIGGIEKSRRSSNDGIVISIAGLEIILPFVLTPVVFVSNKTQLRNGGFIFGNGLLLNSAIFVFYLVVTAI